MTIARFVIALIIVLFTAYVVVMNWGCVIASIRNKRRGIDRHYSMVPIFSFMLAVLAYGIYPHANKSWIMLIPLLDISNWNLLLLPLLGSGSGRKSEPTRDLIESA